MRNEIPYIEEKHEQIKKISLETRDLIIAKNKKRNEAINKNKFKKNLQVGDICFVKDKQIILGNPRPLKSTFSSSPYVVVKPLFTTTIVKRICDNFEQLYHNDSIKKYIPLDPIFKGLPEAVRNILDKTPNITDLNTKHRNTIQKLDKYDFPGGKDLEHYLTEPNPDTHLLYDSQENEHRPEDNVRKGTDQPDSSDEEQDIEEIETETNLETGARLLENQTTETENEKETKLDKVGKTETDSIVQEQTRREIPYSLRERKHKPNYVATNQRKRSVRTHLGE